MLLLIDTSGESALVILSAGGKTISSSGNDVSREHSSWLHPAIARMLSDINVSPAALNAVAVMAGPGSYTGLRVGMAAAKGFCFGLGIPLIVCSTLEVMAASMITLSPGSPAFFCPMIDARRQEVFAALYTPDLELVIPPRPVILDKNSFEQQLKEKSVVFGGSGAVKWQQICASDAASFMPQLHVKESFVKIATARFDHALWADTAYSEPDYGKEFHTHVEI